MSLRNRLRGALRWVVKSGPAASFGEPWPAVPRREGTGINGAPTDEAERLRAREVTDHKAWLRENAEIVVVPEHPAVALLRDIEWRGDIAQPMGSGCPSCHQASSTGHAPGCRLAAILAGSKPGERALSELLAEERAKGAAEEREACARMVRDGDGDRWDDQGISAAICARGAS